MNSYRTNLPFETLKQELELAGTKIKVEENQAYNYLLTDAVSGEKFYFDKYAKGIQVEDWKEMWNKFNDQYLAGVIEDVRIQEGTNKDNKPTKGLVITIDCPDAKAYFKKFFFLEGYSELATKYDANDLAKLKKDLGQEDVYKWVGTEVTVKHNIKNDYEHWYIYAKTDGPTFDKPDYTEFKGMICPVIGDISIKCEGVSKAGKDYAIFACDFKYGPEIRHVEIFQSKDPAQGLYGTQLEKFNRIKSYIDRGLPAFVNFKDPKWPALKFEFPKKGEKRESAGMRLSQIKTA